MITDVLLKTKMPELKLFKEGKVREVYEVENKLLIVATDRISAFDCILPNGITNKGRVLTNLSAFWFGLMKDIVANHMITTNVDEFPESVKKYRNELEGRAMLVRKTNPFPIECVVRGYLAGSGWKEYQKSQSICGIKLKKGYVQADKLDEPIFTPATKAESGHDENISLERCAEIIGEEKTAALKKISIEIYKRAHEYALKRGIIISDTKFEFGLIGDEIILIDEILTPDSSRFWDKSGYKTGESPKNFDKQFVRDYLETLDWDKQPPAPELPTEIVERTSMRYCQAFKNITGRDL